MFAYKPKNIADMICFYTFYIILILYNSFSFFLTFLKKYNSKIFTFKNWILIGICSIALITVNVIKFINQKDLNLESYNGLTFLTIFIILTEIYRLIENMLKK